MTIQANNLTKKYSAKTTALNNISLDIGTGIFGLLGKNGSGKTTLMRIITTLLEPTQGELTVLNLDISKKENQEIVKRNIGYLPQEFGFYKEYTILEIMEFICYMRGIQRTQQNDLIFNALEKVNLANEGKKKYRQLSGGMKRRVGLAQAILNNPQILIVDEPTAGVDPEERIAIRRFLGEYAQDKTVLFSTHIVEDIEYTCNKLAILDKGELLFSGSIKNLFQQVQGAMYEFVFNSHDGFKEFERNHKVISFRRDGDKVHAIVAYHDEPALNGGSAYNASLEEAYIYLTTATEV